MTRVLVTGPRWYGEFIDGKPLRQALDERHRVFATLDAEHAKTPITVIIHGACTIGRSMVGADRYVDYWALQHDIPRERYPVDHALDGPWPAAGPRRNKRILDQSKPDRGITFMPPPGTEGKGTLGMVALMKRAGLDVLEIGA